MKFPVAIVVAVLVWSTAKYIPPYFLELRKMDLMEDRIHADSARQVALLRQIRMELQARNAAQAGEPGIEKRFY